MVPFHVFISCMNRYLIVIHSTNLFQLNIDICVVTSDTLTLSIDFLLEAQLRCIAMSLTAINRYIEGREIVLYHLISHKL
jgi:hypothetical protein